MPNIQDRMNPNTTGNIRYPRILSIIGDALCFSDCNIFTAILKIEKKGRYIATQNIAILASSMVSSFCVYIYAIS